MQEDGKLFWRGESGCTFKNVSSTEGTQQKRSAPAPPGFVGLLFDKGGAPR